MDNLCQEIAMESVLINKTDLAIFAQKVYNMAKTLITKEREFSKGWDLMTDIIKFKQGDDIYGILYLFQILSDERNTKGLTSNQYARYANKAIDLLMYFRYTHTSWDLFGDASVDEIISIVRVVFKMGRIGMRINDQRIIEQIDEMLAYVQEDAVF